MGRKLRIDMIGVRFGRLVGIGFADCSASGHARWWFACDCGAELVADGRNVRSGNTTSCGCLHRESSAARLTVHGHRAAKRHEATYRAWQSMNDGCNNSRSANFPNCGAAGISVCARWRCDYTAFLQDMGERPRGTRLGRHDPANDFRRDNCAWFPVAPRPERAAAGWRHRSLPVRAPRPSVRAARTSAP